MAKIADIEFVELNPKAIKESWDEKSIWSPVLPCFIVRITADNGTAGHGEATSQVWYLGETAQQIAATLAIYRKHLIGADATNIAAANHMMEMSFSGGMPGGRTARSGIDMALHDLVGKLWACLSALCLGARDANIST